MFGRHVTSKAVRGLKALGLLGGAMILCGLAADRWLWPLPYERLTRPHAQFVYDREGDLIGAFTSPDRFWRKPVRLADLSPKLVETVIACEDQWFHWHPGVNPVSLVQAAAANFKAGRIVRGGSTITMQIARMAEPKPRTVFSKMQEMLRAVQLEMHFSKDELLEMYFNLAPYGGNIEGVGAASLFYFNKSPDHLSLAECAVLASIPVSPNDYRPDRSLESCRSKRNRVLKYLLENEVIANDAYRAALAEEIPPQRLTVPVIAPHYCQSVTAARPEASTLTGTLDRELQHRCEGLVQRHHHATAPLDIHNLSVVVLDNASGDILAMVGSADFGDTRHQGQINGALAPRSPGSTLKPFVYALALDQGVVSPEYRTADIPANFSGYLPENYDEKYHGLVSIHDALIQSYNVPAVRTASNLGLQRLYDLLKRGGVSTLTRPWHEYGLPLVLGGCEIPLLELSGLYAALARSGRSVTPRWTTDQPIAEGDSILSPEACYLISDMLLDLKRPDLPTSWESAKDLPSIAWKTGTSYGRRDAWTVGYNPQYTVGVWAGNFTGEGSIDIVGSQIAAPLMFDIFNELSPGSEPTWFDRPPGVAVRRVCAVSGKPAGQFCKETVLEPYLAGVSPTQTCDIHQLVLIDNQTGYRLTREASHGRSFTERIVEHWPPRVAAWLAASGRADVVPSYDPSGSQVSATAQPVITSPDNDAVYVLQEGVPSEYQRILLEASTAPGCRTVHWFIDKQLYQTCRTGTRVFYSPSRGRHELMCLDDQGRSRTIAFEVR